jgi:hypothetical protein
MCDSLSVTLVASPIGWATAKTLKEKPPFACMIDHAFMGCYP